MGREPVIIFLDNVKNSVKLKYNKQYLTKNGVPFLAALGFLIQTNSP